MSEPGRRRAPLLEALVGAVRPEFRADTLVFAATDAVFGGGECRVGGCSRSARGQGLCPGHHLRWVTEGRCDLDVFVVSTDVRWRRQRPNAVCRAGTCGYGVARAGLCQLHYQRWDRAGRAELDGWLSDAPPVKAPRAGSTCALEQCELWPQAALPFCHAHASTWRANGRPDAASFARRFAEVTTTEEEIIRLGDLIPQLRLEIQFALQCRSDERATKTSPAVVMAVVRFLATQEVVSLLDRGEDDWRPLIGRPAPKDANPRAFLVYARRKVADLADADGWEGEFGRNIWQLRRLGYEGNQTLDFTVVGQPWLRHLAMRWLRWRLGTGLNLETARRGLRSVTRFSAFCDTAGVTSLGGINRALLERYLADLHAEWAGRQRHNDHIGQLASFLAAIRQHRWDDSLPAGALIFNDDYPKRSERAPRALGEAVMAQIERPDNLDRWVNPAFRLVTMILIRAGLRVNDALRLPRDCVVTDAGGAPYLRYVNHKMKREALVPIDEEIRALIGDQAARVAEAPWLFPRQTKNPDGRTPVASSTYRGALYRWLGDCNITDAHGRPVHLTPHQWRHTLGTRLINRDVPQEVVRRILDHDSPQMTAHYARLHDSTVRRHWEAARKVDITGETVTVDPDGPLAEAAWAKQRLGQATQALPNGFCGLPVQQACPHANACLTCPMFLTTVEFLPRHREHRNQTVQLITAAEARGQGRLVEMNRQVLANLDRVIASLDDDAAAGDRVADAG
ncbi:MAG: site-specific integrase [Actinomycetota bacterium]|nr:site-specific integrase [Actinomycetota bacterium]